MINDQKDLILALKKLVPLSELSPEQLTEVIRHMIVQTLPAGRILFHCGESSAHAIYLIDGELELNDAKQSQLIQGGSDASSFALDTQHYTATAHSDIQFVMVDKNKLDILLTWDQNAGVAVTELDEAANSEQSDIDWMTTILASPIFHKIPPANIQAMFERMERVEVEQEQIVIRQGEPADYYYAIQQGHALVIRNSEETGYKDEVVAGLEAGQGFGEDALLSDSTRNATVQMLSNGVLMRLAKQDFEALLKEPVLNTLDYDEAFELYNDGAVWLDVRLPSEYHNDAIPDSINLPLNQLRLNLSSLEEDIKYIVYCDTGRRSASAAYILSEYGLDAYVLDGGLNNL